MLSLDLVAQINAVIAPRTGHSFVFVSNRFCTGYLLLLDERTRRLVARRGWAFRALE